MIDEGTQGDLGTWEEVLGLGASVSVRDTGSVGHLLLPELTLRLQLSPLAWLLSCQEGGMSMGTAAFLST